MCALSFVGKAAHLLSITGLSQLQRMECPVITHSYSTGGSPAGMNAVPEQHNMIRPNAPVTEKLSWRLSVNLKIV